MNIAFVPVRGGSKSIPLKNIKIFCGKPLVYWSLYALQFSDSIDKIYVATDSNEIKEVVNEFNFSKIEIYDRDASNAQDGSSTESVMLEFINKKKFNDEDLFILAQATSPIIRSHDFDESIELISKNNYDSLLSCVRIKRFFWKDEGYSLNYDYKNRPRRQDFDGSLMENGALYINKIKNITTSQNRLTGCIGIYEMPEFTLVEIDEDDDWIIAERLMQKHMELGKSKTFNVKLFLSDVDGTLTDAGMYYTESGDEFKKFNTHDGKSFELMRNAGIKTGLITSEITKIVENRSKKLKVDYLYQGVANKGKLEIVKDICKQEGISLKEVAYIGDDINCKELLISVGVCACPLNALDEIKNITNIIRLTKKGGDGAVREFANIILNTKQ